MRTPLGKACDASTTKLLVELLAEPRRVRNMLISQHRRTIEPARDEDDLAVLPHSNVGQHQGGGPPVSAGTEADPQSASAYNSRPLVFMLFLICTLNFADRAVFSALAQTIKADVRLSDLELGLL